MLVPLVQWHLVQLGLGSIQSLFHALKSGVAPVGSFVGVRRGGLGCWPIRKAVPFVELLLQYVGIPEISNIAYFPNMFHQSSLSLEQRLEGDRQEEM